MKKLISVLILLSFSGCTIPFWVQIGEEVIETGIEIEKHYEETP